MQSPKDHSPGAERLAGRYTVLGELGKGGMGVVYRVHDATRNREMALKRLSITSEKNAERVARLFEQEFHTLCHLAHPRIVRVDDYGVEEGGAYYTMEYLDGGDLRELSPLPFRRVCALLRDVCSALSLLHSRHRVHRDLTPRNVRCTADGKAKLIDLGAMTQAGPCRMVVGTPVYIAPEALNAQRVDARTDLFALGATAYYALTGRSAFRASRLDGLRSAWRTAPVAPSHFVPDVPPELDELVLSLLHLEPLARPASAAEVMERLSAIADLPLDEQLVVHQAYLSTPLLVGRDEPLMRVRKHLLRAAHGRATPLAILGPTGMGRSRFLDACALEAKMLGGIVLRADGADGAQGDWGAARALIRQLFVVLPEAAPQAARPHADVLVHVVPELGELLVEGSDAAREPPPPPAQFDSTQHGRILIGETVQRFMRQVLRSRFVVLAIDDVDLLDGPSAALLALLSKDSEASQWVVAGTWAGALEQDAAGREELGPHAWLLRSASRVVLEPFDREQTLSVLTSIFGRVPNLRTLTDHLFTVSRGTPRALMHLSQHLLDRGIVRYEAGHWQLPERLDAAELPRAVGDALCAKLDGLDAKTLEFAQALSLSKLTRVHIAECQQLLGEESGARVVPVLDALIQADVLRTDGEGYGLSHGSWEPLLLERLAPERRAALHLRAAETLRERPHQRFCVIEHLLAGERTEAALDALHQLIADYESAEKSNAISAYEFAADMPHGWERAYRALIQHSAELGRPARERFELMRHLVGFSSMTAVTPHEEIDQVSRQLHHDCGLDLYAALDTELPAAERLHTALAEAQARYDRTPELERAWSPVEAIPRLARSLLHVMGVTGRTLDYDLLEAAPSLEPLTALSPALRAIEGSRQTTLDMLAGRTVRAMRRLNRRIEELSDDGIDGLDPRVQLIMLDAATWMLGTLEAEAGIGGAARRADAIEGNPLYEVSAFRMRAQHALRMGNVNRAEALEQHLELLRMRNKPPQIHEGTELLVEALSHAETDDLIRVKEALAALERVAAQHRGWVPCLELTRGHYQRLRGDHSRALHHFEQALEMAKQDRHVLWAPCAGARITALLELGRSEEALQDALSICEALDAESLRGMWIHVRAPLALALAHGGQMEAAVEHADAVVDDAMQRGISGVPLGIALETRARIALLMGDDQAFRISAERVAAEYRAGHNPALTAKYERLMREAARREVSVSRSLAEAAEETQQSEARHPEAMLATILSECRDAGERAERALQLLVDAACASAGYLYLMRAGGPVLVATRGAAAPPDDMDAAVSQYMALKHVDGATLTAAMTETLDVSAVVGRWTGRAGDRFVPFTLSHATECDLAITGVVLVAVGDADDLGVPYSLLAALSRSLTSSGDAVVAVAS